ncbi:S8 family peptidase [Anaerolentibacter hominis]|uniref:S8 family peptidase n=1 Tax=Anaerolentibacter hominis TaxID=3079009 RepID=UPI0031B7ED30
MSWFQEVGLDEVHRRGVYGAGVGVAVLDTGLYPHPDFGNRITAFYDALKKKDSPYDDASHGTHVAGLIGGDGSASGGRYIGAAPACSLIGVKVLNHQGNGMIPDVLIGLNWILENKTKYNIRILNISVGTKGDTLADEDSVLVKAVEEVWNAGIVVVAAAANNGPLPGSIGSPGISRKIITVGASNDYVPIESRGRKLKNYSGRGPTASCIRKPDIVAPGAKMISCNVPNSANRNLYAVKSGTSMATPVVSGAIALLLSRYPEMTTREVKIRLKESAVDLGLPGNQQGWGQLDAGRLVFGS